MTKTYKIAILLPTRGRTDSLKRSVTSIISKAKNLDNIQLIMGLDHDDEIGLEYFNSEIEPWLDNSGVDYSVMGFDRLGYGALNRYYNTLAESADADWIFVWNDDAIMHTQDWDTVIAKCTGKFKLLKVHTHNDHPYSIFPIVPAAWIELLGYISLHQMIDAEVSQIAYMLDLMEIIEIDVTHDQSDLTGEEDDTSKNKMRFEGNPLDPRDFHNHSRIQRRIEDCDKLAEHMLSIGMSIDWWKRVKINQQDPWAKLKENDVNKQMIQFHAVRDPITNTTRIVKDNV
jgi:hypothetical protein